MPLNRCTSESSAEKIKSKENWGLKRHRGLCRCTLTLHEFGGTRSCVISPACTQNLCSRDPLYKSHKQTAKSTPPESKWALSYLELGTNTFWIANGGKIHRGIPTWNELTMDTTNSSHGHDDRTEFDVAANLMKKNDYESKWCNTQQFLPLKFWWFKCKSCSITVCVAGTMIMEPSSLPTTKRLCCGK